MGNSKLPVQNNTDSTVWVRIDNDKTRISEVTANIGAASI